jgi:translation initiation factor IF-2
MAASTQIYGEDTAKFQVGAPRGALGARPAGFGGAHMRPADLRAPPSGRQEGLARAAAARAAAPDASAGPACQRRLGPAPASPLPPPCACRPLTGPSRAGPGGGQLAAPVAQLAPARPARLPHVAAAHRGCGVPHHALHQRGRAAAVRDVPAGARGAGGGGGERGGGGGAPGRAGRIPLCGRASRRSRAVGRRGRADAGSMHPVHTAWPPFLALLAALLHPAPSSPPPSSCCGRGTARATA